MNSILLLLLVTASCGAASQQHHHQQSSSAAAAHAVRVEINATQFSPFKHFWKECVGSGHALLGTRRDWQEALKRVVDDIGFRRVRMHGIFNDDMSVVLGPGKYEFYDVDQVYDGMLALGVRPIVELSFMPGLLAGCSPWVSGGPPCQYVMHYQGIVMPPTNFTMWSELVANFARHLLDRYGAAEVHGWHFEVWNELWGMPYEPLYTQLYTASYTGLKSVDPKLKIGGPATMQCQFVGEFVHDMAGKYDFVSTHLYPTDPNCTWPAAGSGDMDCFANTIKSAHAKAMAADPTKPFFLTEFNAGLFNSELLYSSYAAAFLFRNVPLLHGVLDVWSYWTFTDIFEEDGMHGAPFAGFNYGIQTQRGIRKPVYRAFQLLNTAGSQLAQSQVVSTRVHNESLTAFATADNSGSSAFLSNFAPQGFAIADVEATVVVVSSGNGCQDRAMATWVDATHGNAHHAWTMMGSPAYPTDEQLAALSVASEPGTKDLAVSVTPSGDCTVKILLKPFTALRIDFKFV